MGFCFKDFFQDSILIWKHFSSQINQGPLHVFKTQSITIVITSLFKNNHCFWRHTCVAAAKTLQLCPTLCEPIDGSPPGSSVPGILQARMLEWVTISFSNAGKWKVKMKFLSHVWLSDPVDCSLPAVSSVDGIFQARVLVWVAIAFSAYLC